MKEIDGKYISNLKSNVILPYLNDSVNYFRQNSTINKGEFVKKIWNELEEILKSHNLPSETFKDLNVIYRKFIEDKIIHNKN